MKELSGLSLHEANSFFLCATIILLMIDVRHLPILHALQEQPPATFGWPFGFSG